ncbi:MAG TPA: DegT/DnrJ/EryC1/StrS family aminotransferase [Phycisphaeraceae bacterium]|nr:DegT/DnrJ/EryC1/StrS family aminotransferase [Phycisphaeraceae bacterium]
MATDEIPLSRPDITQLEIDLVTEVLRSDRLALGPMIEKFEQLVAAKVQREHGIAVNSGTSGLHLTLLALGIGPGDEVITTPFSFIATSNAILYVGATPVFVDIDPTSLNMDPAKVEAAITPRTKAILAVEVFGNPAHMDTLAAIAGKHEIPFIEDCCEGLGGSYKGRPIGSFGRVGVFSFYPNKQVTTGEGGMIVTDDDRLAEICRSLRNQGRGSGDVGWQHGTGAWLEHVRLGYNYRMSEMQAALGVGQIMRLGELMEARERVAQRYFQRLMGMSDIIVPTISTDTRMSWFVYVVRLSADYSGAERDRIINNLRNHDVGAANYFPPIHHQPLYRRLLENNMPHLPVCESVSQRTIALPFHTKLTDREIDLVVQTLDVMMRRSEFGRR